MTVGDAKNIARQWVEKHKGEIEGFSGAHFTGSINFKPEEDADFADMLKKQVLSILGNMTQAYYYAIQVIRTPFFFDFDICEAARSVCIGGSHQMIDDGNHRASEKAEKLRP